MYHNDYYVDVPHGETINLRAEASGTARVVTRIKRGCIVRRFGTFGDYFGVDYTNKNGIKYSGFILIQYLTHDYIDQDPDWYYRYGTTAWKKNAHSKKFYQAVKNIQSDLKKLGYNSINKADGYYGQKTETAIKNFQINNGLNSDGICGNNTKQKLWNKHK